MPTSQATLQLTPDVQVITAPSASPPPPDEIDPQIVPLAVAKPSIGGIAAGMPFDLKIKILRSDGTIDTTYRGKVTWTSDDTTKDPAYPVVLPKPYTYTADDAGVHKFTGFILRTVAGTGFQRDLTLSGTNSLNTRTFTVDVFFNALATREGLVGKPTAYGHIIKPNDHFVALPAHNLKKQPILLVRGKDAISTKVLDIGPFFGSNSRPDDPYWTTRGRPRTEIELVGNLAGIDLADGTFTQAPPKGLRLVDNTRIFWRFM